MGSKSCRNKINFPLVLFFIFSLAVVSVQLSLAEEVGCQGAGEAIQLIKTWKHSEAKDGNLYYRAIVYTYLQEPWTSYIQIQIIKLIKPEKEKYRKKIIRCFWLDESYYRTYIRDIFFKKINDELVAFTVDTEDDIRRMLVFRTVYLVKPDGSFKKISFSKYLDPIFFYDESYFDDKHTKRNK